MPSESEIPEAYLHVALLKIAHALACPCNVGKDFFFSSAIFWEDLLLWEAKGINKIMFLFYLWAWYDLELISANT